MMLFIWSLVSVAFTLLAVSIKEEAKLKKPNITQHFLAWTAAWGFYQACWWGAYWVLTS